MASEQNTSSPALYLSDAVMQPALERNTRALDAMLDPMRRVASMTLSNEVSTTQIYSQEVTCASCATPVRTQIGGRAALHQVTCACRNKRGCKLPPPYEPPVQPQN